MDSDLCVEPRPSEFDLCRPFRMFVESLRVAVEEEDELTCEGAVGCCDDRARDDLLGDILERENILDPA